MEPLATWSRVNCLLTHTVITAIKPFHLNAKNNQLNDTRRFSFFITKVTKSTSKKYFSNKLDNRIFQ